MLSMLDSSPGAADCNSEHQYTSLLKGIKTFNNCLLQKTMDSKSSHNDNLENIAKVLKKIRDYTILFLTFVLYRMARILVLTFQKFTWVVTGVEKIRRDTRSGLAFRQSAHVQDVKWRRKIHPLDFADPSNFITFHNSFKHPNCVLKPEVSLYCITKKEAVFIEVNEGVNVYQSGKGTNFYTSQYQNARRLITIPLGVFQKLAQDLGDPRMPVIMISNTGRCGASLLGRMFEEVPGTLLIEEPDSLSNLAYLKKSSAFSDTEYSNILVSALRLLCKPDDRAGMICIKTRPCCCVHVRRIHSLLPNIRHIFLYRNSLRTVSSYIGSMSGESTTQCARFIIDNGLLSTIMPCFRRLLYHYFCYVLDNDPPVSHPGSLCTVGIYTTLWAACVAHIVEATDKGIPIIVILHDEMMKNPQRSCTVLFDLLGIRSQYSNAAVRAFRIDLNRNPSQAIANVDSRRTIAPEMRSEADRILKQFGLPKLGERFEIHGLTNFDPPAFSKSLSKDKLIGLPGRYNAYR